MTAVAPRGAFGGAVNLQPSARVSLIFQFTYHINSCMSFVKSANRIWYNQSFRTEVVSSALHAYDEMKAKDTRGEEPLYCSRQ